MRRLLLAAALTLPLLAGCLGGEDLRDQRAASPFEGLDAPGAIEVLEEAGARVFVFNGTAGTLPTWAFEAPFEVDVRVGFVEVSLAADKPAELGIVLRDAEGREQCGVLVPALEKVCTSPLPPGLEGEQAWSFAVVHGVIVGPTSAPRTPQLPFEVRVALHPADHLRVGDPRLGVDALIPFRAVDTGAEHGGEPTVGLLADGTIFAQELTQTMRSRDDGATWEDVGPATTSQTTLDPMLRVDPWTGKVYVAQLTVACIILAWSDDGGATWLTNPAACGFPGIDHQKLATGPHPVPAAPFPALYMAWSQIYRVVTDTPNANLLVSRSLDGGLTWTNAPVEFGSATGRAPRNIGPVEADREGNVYAPMYLCDGDGGIGAGVSNDHGATFRFVEVARDPGPCEDPDPGLAIDEEGTVYIAYHRPDGIKYASSKDRGATWSAPRTVSPPGLGSFVHVDAAAGDAGRVAIAYRATPDTAKISRLADGWAAWHLYVTFVEGADGSLPGVRTALATPAEDPTQRGQICHWNGCVGTGAGNRNLLDFLDIQAGPDGRVYVVYTDGCDGACPTPADSRSSMGYVAIQAGGPRLFAREAPWAG